jgi:hypothetical protein
MLTWGTSPGTKLAARAGASEAAVGLGLAGSSAGDGDFLGDGEGSGVGDFFGEADFFGDDDELFFAFFDFVFRDGVGEAFFFFLEGVGVASSSDSDFFFAFGVSLGFGELFALFFFGDAFGFGEDDLSADGEDLGFGVG